MPTLSDALTVLFPAADPRSAWDIRDDGDGPYIAAWHLPDSQPTPGQIAAVTDAQVAAARVGRTVARAGDLLTSDDPIPQSVRVMLRVICTRVNTAFESMGQPKPLIEADIMADVVAALAAGESLSGVSASA